MSDMFLLGRQPILDREEKVFAYALMFRPAESLQLHTLNDGSFPAGGVIIDVLSDAGAHELLGEGKGVINIGYDLLMNDAVTTLPANRIILELNENLPLTSGVIHRCRTLKESGFTLALHNHLFSRELTELYGTVDIVGIDLNQTPSGWIKNSVQQFRRYPVRLLVDKVDTRDEFNQCRTMGFDLFQGFFFASPTMTAKKKLNETASTLLRIALLIINDAGVESIVRTVQESPALTYKLLLQANSAVVGARQEIDSVRHAILLLGRDQIRRWAQAELMVSNGSQEQDNPLVEMAMMRASFMEQFSKIHPKLRDSRDAADRAFLAGTLSTLEMIYNVSIENVVESVELSADVKKALLLREGLFGEMLMFVEAMERLDFHRVRRMLPKLNISPAQILDAQRKSFPRKAGGVGCSMI